MNYKSFIIFLYGQNDSRKIPNGKLRLSFEFTNFIPGISEVYFHFVTEVGYHSGLAEEIKTPSSAYVLNKRKDLLEISEQLKMASEKVIGTLKQVYLNLVWKYSLN